MKSHPRRWLESVSEEMDWGFAFRRLTCAMALTLGWAGDSND